MRFLRQPWWAGEPLSRREWLRIGGLAGLGLLAPNVGVPTALATGTKERSAIPGFGRAKSVILIYASGGQSQLDMWDPKPDAPLEIRGEFQSIPTTVPGTRLCEHLPRMARLTDLYTIVRSVSHDDLDHGSATYLALTGRFHARKSSNPPPTPNDDPTYGSILKRVRPTARFPYDAVHVNAPALVPELPSPGQDGGFLGRDYEPLVLGDVSKNQIAIPCLDLQPELTGRRLAQRQSLRGLLESATRTLEQNRKLADVDNMYQQAFDLLSSPRCRQAFDLTAETSATRDSYGRYRPGQACLLARRLVEAGVPLVTVVWSHSNRGQDKQPTVTEEYGWDTHNDIFDALKNRLLPRFDQTFATLLEDLQERGLLDDTLVVCMGEFGRAPVVALEKRFAGSSPGRKHWASVYSIVMAGAGVTGGALYGASDKIGGQPHANVVSPCDIAATMFSALGIDPEGHYTDSLGRPFPISVGKPISGLYGS